MAPIRGRYAGVVGVMLAVALGACSRPAIAQANPAQPLRDRYAALQARLDEGPYHRPLRLESAERSRNWQGDVYALVDYPYVAVAGALTNANSWCDALILHLNVKYCRADTGAAGTVLSVAIGRKTFQALDRTHRVEFSYVVDAPEAQFISVVLEAARGPFGTRKYRIALEAMPIDDGRTFVHLRYSFGYGLQGGLAMGAYFATAGAGKVGFTEIGSRDGSPRFVGGVRGAVERNAMRYYLAIDAYLGALATPEPERFEHSLDLWFTATELYPRQLHEINRDAYLVMKRREYARQRERNRPDATAAAPVRMPVSRNRVTSSRRACVSAYPSAISSRV